MKTDEATVSGKRSASVASATIFNHVTAESAARTLCGVVQGRILTILKSLFEKCFFFFLVLQFEGERYLPEWLWADFSVNNSAFSAPLVLCCCLV